jgi:phage N-6-adenine-methyltransferase
VNTVHFSSKSDDWATPQALFDRLNAKYGPFDLDVCASAENAKCARFYTKEQNGLVQPWLGRVWMNPPYGRGEKACRARCHKEKCAKRGHHLSATVPGIGDWVLKAFHNVFITETAALVCMLLPARTDNAWWHEYVLPNAEVEFLKGRVKFGGHKNSAPFPSVVAVFRR